MTVENNETPSAFGGGGGARTSTYAASSSAASEDIVELPRRRESTSATTEGSMSQVRTDVRGLGYSVSQMLGMSANNWHF